MPVEPCNKHRLRQRLELMREMRANIDNLERIYHQEELALQRDAGENNLTLRRISGIIRRYREVCSLRDIDISYPDLFEETTTFWLHVSRLTLVWVLEKTHSFPAVRYTIAANAMLGLLSLSPRLLDVL